VDYVEIEVRARSIDLAMEAAMQEFGVTDPGMLSVEVVSEPVKGFLGMGGQDGVYRVKPRPKGNRNRRRRGGKERSETPRNREQPPRDSAKNKGGRHEARPNGKREKNLSDDRPVLPIEEQARIAHEFLDGLLDAYGLEGTVTTQIEDDVIVADVSGDQTEALVGVRGAVRAAIHELTRTVMQRYGQDSARLRLDIAGYAERRRQALAIYARQLIEQLDAEGGEIMLEPMSPADRKVIHDAAAEYPGIASYSEGEPPRRYVVLSKVGGEEE
jgi:spoIIIJ-associated protein